MAGLREILILLLSNSFLLISCAHEIFATQTHTNNIPKIDKSYQDISKYKNLSKTENLKFFQIQCFFYICKRKQKRKKEKAH